MAGFLSRLTGGEDKEFDQEGVFEEKETEYTVNDLDSENEEISLSADMYEDEENLFVKIFIAGVNPKELDIDVSRDILTVSGERYDFDEKTSEQFIQRELS